MEDDLPTRSPSPYLLGDCQEPECRQLHCITVDLFHRTGSVTKKKYDSANLPRKMTDVVQFLLLQLILERPGIYLRELQAEVKLVTGLELAASTICQFFMLKVSLGKKCSL